MSSKANQNGIYNLCQEGWNISLNPRWELKKDQCKQPIGFYDMPAFIPSFIPHPVSLSLEAFVWTREEWITAAVVMK